MSKKATLKERIEKRGSQFCVVSKDGSKELGCFDTKEQAQKRLDEVEFFKRTKKQQESAAQFIASLVVAGRFEADPDKAQKVLARVATTLETFASNSQEVTIPALRNLEADINLACSFMSAYDSGLSAEQEDQMRLAETHLGMVCRPLRDFMVDPATMDAEAISSMQQTLRSAQELLTKIQSAPAPTDSSAEEDETVVSAQESRAIWLEAAFDEIAKAEPEKRKELLSNLSGSIGGMIKDAKGTGAK